MQFYNNLKMKDLFQNPKLAHVLPQFEKDDKLQNVQSYEWIEKKIKSYLINALGAQNSGNNLIIKGKKSEVLKKIHSLKWTMEGFFNSIPSIAKSLRNNAPLYLPYNNVEQIKNLQNKEKKIQLLNMVLDNLAYNPEFKGLNNKNIDIYPSGVPFNKRQSKWIEQVGFWGRKK